MNTLKFSAITAEIAILSATAAVAWGLVADSGNIRITAPIIVAATAVEIVRLPLILRIPKLRVFARIGALTLAITLSTLTAETMLLGFEGLLNARALAVTTAEEKFAEAQVSFDATKADASQRETERRQLITAVEAAQKHSEEIGRESVTLQVNPAVSAYHTKKGWITTGVAVANTVAGSNAKAQADHAKRASAAEADLATAKATLAALHPIDPKIEEAEIVAAKKVVEHERSLSPMHRLAAAIFRVKLGELQIKDYETIRGAATISLALIVAFGSLAAGLISALPERGSMSNKLTRAFRAMMAARRKKLRRVEATVVTKIQDRVVYRYIPIEQTATNNALNSSRRANDD